MLTIGIVPLHRTTFDSKWAVELWDRIRRTILSFIQSMDYNIDLQIVYPSEDIGYNGIVVDDKSALDTIELFRSKKVDSVVLLNLTFGDEISGACIAMEFKDKPIFLAATMEPEPLHDLKLRRSDSYTGTLALASALHRRRLPFIFLGVMSHDDELLKKSMEKVIRISYAYKRLIGSRIGIVGPRPDRFEAVVFNEAELMKRFNLRLVHISIAEILEEARRLEMDDKCVHDVLRDYTRLFSFNDNLREKFMKIAKLECVLRKCINSYALEGLAFKCWTEPQRYYGVAPCLVLSRLTDSGIMTSCEVDVYGLLSMLILYNISLNQNVPFFFDWTIPHSTKENAFLAWHCGNMPLSICKAGCKVSYQVRQALRFGWENAFGTSEGVLKPGDVTILRLMEYDGEFKMLIVKGRVLDEEVPFSGAAGWIEVSGVSSYSQLYDLLVKEGFPHHAALVHGDYVDELVELAKLLKIKTIVIK